MPLPNQQSQLHIKPQRARLSNDSISLKLEPETDILYYRSTTPSPHTHTQKPAEKINNQQSIINFETKDEHRVFSFQHQINLIKKKNPKPRFYLDRNVK
jgi:hypothetical protein